MRLGLAAPASPSGRACVHGAQRGGHTAASDCLPRAFELLPKHPPPMLLAHFSAMLVCDSRTNSAKGAFGDSAGMRGRHRCLVATHFLHQRCAEPRAFTIGRQPKVSFLSRPTKQPLHEGKLDPQRNSRSHNSPTIDAKPDAIIAAPPLVLAYFR
jgi:hypothetical protein